MSSDDDPITSIARQMNNFPKSGSGFDAASAFMNVFFFSSVAAAFIEEEKKLFVTKFPAWYSCEAMRELMIPKAAVAKIWPKKKASSLPFKLAQNTPETTTGSTIVLPSKTSTAVSRELESGSIWWWDWPEDCFNIFRPTGMVNASTRPAPANNDKQENFMIFITKQRTPPVCRRELKIALANAKRDQGNFSWNEVTRIAYSNCFSTRRGDLVL